VYAKAVNDGEQAGNLWVAAFDKKTGTLLGGATAWREPGGTFTLPSKTITVEHDMEIVFQAGLGSTFGQNKTDEWGC